MSGTCYRRGTLAFWQELVTRLTLIALCGWSPVARGAPDAPDADRAWQVILEQANGPGGSRPADRDAAAAMARTHLEKQEKSLRDFVRSFPDDPRRYSARIRLATVLAARGRFLGQPALNAEAAKLLSELETNPATPAPVRADAGFARVSQAMQDLSARPDAGSRDAMLREVRRFDADYPGDRRMAGLLAETANLYDEQPIQKKAILEEAATRTTDPALRDRITDDLRRVGLLHHPLAVRLQPWQGGAPIDLETHRGRIVVLLFWASWSMPALHELAQLQHTAQEFAGQPVDFLTISLDEDRKALASTVEAADLRWPVHCDGRGWKGELVRSLGINALPTVWVLDREGNLLDLNARGGEVAGLIRKALSP